MVGDVRSSVGPSPIKRISASQQVHAALRDRIVSLQLLPGQSLSRTEVSETYGVSQTPVREAMQRLAEEGLLLIFPQSKTEVSRIDIDHARETQFLRLSVELEVTRRLTQAHDPAVLPEIETILQRQERAREAGDMGEFFVLDRSFHRTLCGLVGVETLWDLITARSGHIDRLRNLNLPDPGKPSSIILCHRQILAAIRAGDVPGAEAAVREHLSGTLAQIEDIRARYPQYF
ncbi:GntR family transcriptional regulator [Pseudooceanicola sp. CBS1P-1]|uniref:FCD domain-containing protein n=2 Tax=Paracoccaceae TaxID=31989 RepID=A0A6L7G5W1_9RHOB|nr:GntR family transcriptional regulator [Pseudooceanicola endophyticus]MXN19505.1 FCD domain-containing protein [Pseudooceanicola albus]